MLFGNEAAVKLAKDYSFKTLLDIGSGPPQGVNAANFFKELAKDVTRQDINPDYKPDILGDFNNVATDKLYDCIWCSHVLEHQLNPNFFLTKIFHTLKDGGVLAITVPPAKHEIVGGHVTLWNAGLLLYNLILAGFDCKDAAVKSYGYNISVIVNKRTAILPDLLFDAGDINALNEFFPLGVYEGFDGKIEELNW
jgi:SAM-dependent methyltransferase